MLIIRIKEEKVKKFSVAYCKGMFTKFGPQRAPLGSSLDAGVFPRITKDENL